MSVQLSVVVPNLDSPLVHETVAGVLDGRPRQGVEVLVVGRDGPGVVPKSGGVRLIETPEPVPPAAARNLGVSEARGELVLFTDADCRPAADWIDRMREALVESPVVGGAVDFDLAAGIWAVADNIASFHGLLADRAPEPDTRHPIGSLNLGVRREAWDRVGPFDEQLTTSEDHDWFFRARRAGLRCAFDPAIRVRHAAVRSSRRELMDHAAWYGRSFCDFRARHPGVFDSGFTWRSARRLRSFAALKAWVSAVGIFAAHPKLLPALRALPAVALFRRTWYRTVADHWEPAI